MLIAKPVVKNKFWIVESDGKKIATIQKNPDGVVLVKGNQRQLFSNLKKLGAEVNITFDKVNKKKPVKAELNINGYPTQHSPLSILYDVKNRCYIYTRSKKSKSYYCAGYYLINFNESWVKSFCPKLISIQRYEFQGPFRTEEEVQTQFNISNRQTA